MPQVPHKRTVQLPPAVPVPSQQRVRDLRDYLADVPDPKEFVFCMHPRMVAAVMRAERRKSVWVLSREDAEYLRPFGLADYCTFSLTAFGMAVLRVLESEARQ